MTRKLKYATPALALAVMSIASAYLWAADDKGRRSIAAIPNICKQTDTEARFACSYFVLGFVARMEFEEEQFKRKPTCLANADLGSLNEQLVSKLKTDRSSGRIALDLTAFVLETAKCKPYRRQAGAAVGANFGSVALVDQLVGGG
jgi:hypothetical protein